jgi:hypothetical protein
VKTTYKRKKGGTPPDDYIKITLSDVLVTSVGGEAKKTKVAVKAVMKGQDAELGSLVYALVALELGSDAATVMRNHGYDVTVADSSKPCPDLLSADTCADLAQRLSKAIHASLPDAERNAFHEAAEVFGVSPDTCDFRSP